MFIVTLIFTLGVMVLVMSGIGLRLLLVKGGEFRGTCANNNPMLEKEIGKCTVCGRASGEACKADELQKA
ncbi:MAG TPA: hypothetical protein PK239_00875 [Chitinophagales bacterium]|nr:hypothetical protein [Chitinophagales bacterium]HRK25816.1 hypothetical protein [Chitinophagales bacterium]